MHCISNKTNILMAIIILFRKNLKFKLVFVAVMHWYNGFLIYLTYLLLSFSSSNNQ